MEQEHLARQHKEAKEQVEKAQKQVSYKKYKLK